MLIHQWKLEGSDITNTAFEDYDKRNNEYFLIL